MIVGPETPSSPHPMRMPMVMTVHCPSCSTAFPVDPAKLPPGGVYARCSMCMAVFFVAPPDGAPSAPGMGTGTTAHAEDSTVDSPAQVAAPRRDGSGSAMPEEPADWGGAPLTPFSLEARDPHARARRLARILASDMVAYDPARHAMALESGSLPSEFAEDIRRSWDAYVRRVGDELATRTSYFDDALNDILARGRRIFPSGE